MRVLMSGQDHLEQIDFIFISRYNQIVYDGDIRLVT